MTYKASTGWVLLVSWLSLFSCSEAKGTQIDYSPKLDAICAIVSGPGIKEPWKDELESVIPLFEKEWEELGSQLLLGSETVLGRRLNPNITANLTLCNTPSRARPVVVNMRYALKSFTDEPVSLRIKVGTLHHEILHREIDALVPTNSALLDEYSNEHERVRGHLHLLAIQKATYLELAFHDELAEVIDVDSQLPNGYYKRAWEIVNEEPERYQDFVLEVRQSGWVRR